MTCCYYFYVTYLSVKPFPKGTTYLMTDAKLTNLEGKMNDLIKHYEVLTTDASASKLSTVLTAKNIYYYDEQKAITGLTFDKRSPEEI
ncbi:hypothetical protein GGI19_004982 [Coemansia pectinata]|uniref:Uncharacterized protein n=1 Tax=Coemansia pectinata TaxID=1052879 RepID=A0A9W8GUZ8_9FUNG|nr:hypothetical protein GGI19_004982 [Coemansia pectinata]